VPTLAPTPAPTTAAQVTSAATHVITQSATLTTSRAAELTTSAGVMVLEGTHTGAVLSAATSIAPAALTCVALVIVIALM
jgi:hypothetical protein